MLLHYGASFFEVLLQYGVTDLTVKQYSSTGLAVLLYGGTVLAVLQSRGKPFVVRF